MSNYQPFNKVIIFDTDSYAGNFEREMCAYVTGQYGECEVGRELAEAVLPTLSHADWYEKHVVSEPDEHGCWRPTSIWPNAVEPTHSYESVAIFVDEFPPLEVWNEMLARARAFCSSETPGLTAETSLALKYGSGPRVLSGVHFFEPTYRLDECSPYGSEPLA
jgi:hypothetical protein